jgi:hypothetical protein
MTPPTSFDKQAPVAAMAINIWALEMQKVAKKVPALLNRGTCCLLRSSAMESQPPLPYQACFERLGLLEQYVELRTPKYI